MDDDLQPELDVGDVVVLASGGPSMTVTEIVPGPYINSPRVFRCQWFGHEDHLQEAEFPRECLRITDGLLVDEDEE